MELQFIISAEDICRLNDKVINRHLINYENRLAKIDLFILKWLPIIFKLVIPAIAFIVTFYLPGWESKGSATDSSTTKTISIIIMATLYYWLWRRYGKHWLSYFSKYVIKNRLRETIRHRTRKFITRSIAKRLSAIEGKYQMKLENEQLTFIKSECIMATLSLSDIVKLSEEDDFYIIATKRLNRLGLCYRIPKNSDVMDETEYKENLKYILIKLQGAKL